MDLNLKSFLVFDINKMELVTAVFVVLISILTIWYAFNKQRYSFNYWKKRNVPTIPYDNLQGVGEKFHMSYVIKSIYDKFKGTGAKFCGAYFYYSRPVAILLDPELMKDILVRYFENFMDRGIYYNRRDDPLSSNLSTIGDDWKELRYKLTPTFTSAKMKVNYKTNKVTFYKKKKTCFIFFLFNSSLCVQ